MRQLTENEVKDLKIPDEELENVSGGLSYSFGRTKMYFRLTEGESHWLKSTAEGQAVAKKLNIWDKEVDSGEGYFSIHSWIVSGKGYAEDRYNELYDALNSAGVLDQGSMRYGG